LIIARIRA
jgi:hypothetical protein